MDVNIADDFALVTDWLKPATVDGTACQKTLRREVTTQEALASGGKYLASDTVFHVDRAERTDRPSLGSQIVDADATWTILSVQLQTLANRWRCVCRQLWIDSTDAGNRVTIQRASFNKGATGGLEPTWTTLLANVLARVQYQSAEVETSQDNRTAVTMVKVFFTQTQSLQPSDRIVTAGGETLKVKSWQGFSELDQFFTAVCEVSKWPQA